MTTALEQTALFGDKKLPTNWVPPRKPSFRESILDDADIKTTILNHKKQSYLNRDQTEKLKNNFKKQLCIEMLKEGYQKSFRELDFILKLQIQDRYRLGSEHPIWDRPLLDQENDKLEYLCKKLNKAEAYERNGNFKNVYLNYYDLANYFLLTDDNWLSDYFFQKCLNITENSQASMEPKRQAEAHCNLGLAFERQNAYHKAMHHFEEYFNMTKGKDWDLQTHFEDLSVKDVENIKKIKKMFYEDNLKSMNIDIMYIDACINLQRIYRIVANKYAKNIDEKIMYLTKSQDVCKSSMITFLEGQASYLLGNAYTENSKLEIALSCYKNFYEISKRDKDLENFGKASEALAKCHEKLGQVNKSIEYLEKYLKEVSNNEADKQYARACNCLASIYNSLGKYDTATDYSKKAFDISRQINQRDAIEFNRVLFGISKAHKNLNNFNENIELATRKTINNLLTWKYEPEREKILLKKESSDENK